MSAPSADASTAEKLAFELKRNRDLTRKLYTLRGEAPPNEHGCARARPLMRGSTVCTWLPLAKRSDACLLMNALPLTRSGV